MGLPLIILVKRVSEKYPRCICYTFEDKAWVLCVLFWKFDKISYPPLFYIVLTFVTNILLTDYLVWNKWILFLLLYLFFISLTNVKVDVQMWSVWNIDLVLIDPKSVGKRTHDPVDTVNAKKRWKTICWRVNKYLKYNHLLPRFGTEQASFCI
jgi:hypothetical protein